QPPFTPTFQDHRVGKVALLIGLACVLQIAESMIPHPVPGLRLGLANMLTLTAMVVLGFGCALEVAILRTVLSSLIMGTFMSPTFILSLSGAVISTLIMGLFYWLSGLSRYCRLSIIGISIVGAFVHNLVQLYMAYLLLVKHPGIFVFLPWLSIGAVGTGWVVGVVTGGVCLRLQQKESITGISSGSTGLNDTALEMRNFTPGNSWLHRQPAEVKLVALFILAAGLLVFPNFELAIGCFLFLGIMLPLSHTPLGYLLQVLRRYRVLILISFFMPLFFNSGTHVLVRLAGLELTIEGLTTGVRFAARILLLIMTSALLVRTTSPEQTVRGLGRLLQPMRIFGLSSHRIAMLLSMAWTALPQLWKTTRDTITSANIKDIKSIRRLLPLLSDLIATLYMQTEPAHGLKGPPSEQEQSEPGGPCVTQ
ncbi:MAG: Gx transporter family protein, partial [Desulfosarcina sp.]